MFSRGCLEEAERAETQLKTLDFPRHLPLVPHHVHDGVGAVQHLGLPRANEVIDVQVTFLVLLPCDPREFAPQGVC